ncbi:hypothetical protein ACFLU6_04085 [Acidobacteriota bacterium]
MNERPYSLVWSLLIIALVFGGCPYESKIPLSTPDKARIDKKLLGEWECEDKWEGKDVFLLITKRGKHEYSMVFEGGSDTYRISAFTTVIDGQKFLNLWEIEPEQENPEYLFVRYTVKKKRLTLRIVEDELFEPDFESSADLYRFIRDHLDDESLYGEAMVFKRKKKKK